MRNKRWEQGKGKGGKQLLGNRGNEKTVLGEDQSNQKNFQIHFLTSKR